MQQNDTNIPSWLQNQERNSWQIELIISGGMIFTLWTLPEFFLLKYQETIITAPFNTSHAIVFFGGLTLSRALLIGFGVNLLLRALWLAFLGVHYAFPNGLDYEKLDYSPHFSDRNSKENDSVSRILLVEKYCSLSFSLAIFMAICTAGALFSMYLLFAYVLEYILPYDLIDTPEFGYIIGFLFIGISFGLLDRLVFRSLKRFKSLQKIFYLISKVISYLNFTWLFKYEWNTLLSNLSRWKLHLTTFGYFLIAFVISLSDYGITDFFSIPIESNVFDHRAYKNPVSSELMQNDEYDMHLGATGLIKEMSIPSEIISSSFLPIFIVYDEFQDETFKFLGKEMGIIMEWERRYGDSIIVKNSESYVEMLDSCFVIKINDQDVSDLKWYYRKHPITEQLGFHTKIDIDSLPRGEHTVKGWFNSYESKLDSGRYFFRVIPFWKE